MVTIKDCDYELLSGTAAVGWWSFLQAAQCSRIRANFCGYYFSFIKAAWMSITAATTTQSRCGYSGTSRMAGASCGWRWLIEAYVSLMVIDLKFWCRLRLSWRLKYGWLGSLCRRTVDIKALLVAYQAARLMVTVAADTRSKLNHDIEYQKQQTDKRRASLFAMCFKY